MENKQQKDEDVDRVSPDMPAKILTCGERPLLKVTDRQSLHLAGSWDMRGSRRYRRSTQQGQEGDNQTPATHSEGPSKHHCTDKTAGEQTGTSRPLSPWALMDAAAANQHQSPERRLRKLQQNNRWHPPDTFSLHDTNYIHHTLTCIIIC